MNLNKNRYTGKNLSNKYSRKPLDSAKKSTTDSIKTASKRTSQKVAEATGDLIGNKIADKTTSASKKSLIRSQNLLDSGAALNTSNQRSKFRAKNWLEINDESKGSYGTGSDIKFKTTMLRSSLCDYAYAYVLVKRTLTITGAGDDDAAKQSDERNKGVIFKNCAPFTKCISRINGTEIDNAQDIDIVMPMHNLNKYSDNFSKTSGSLWQYYQDDPSDSIMQSESFKSKIKIRAKTPAAANTKYVEIAVPLICLSNFWRTLEMQFINCKVNLILT